MTSCLQQAYDLLKEWQTLVAGALAILAAKMATKPVWQQLDRMETQSRIMVRETLVRRIEELEQRRRTARAAVGETVATISQYLGWWDDDGSQIDENWAFERSQVAAMDAGKFRAFRERNRDTPEIELAKDAVAAALTPLIACLDDVHRPASTQQHDDDHDIPDEEWEAIEQRGEAAKLEVNGLHTVLRQASDALDAEYSTSLDLVRTKLVDVDSHLLSSLENT